MNKPLRLGQYLLTLILFISSVESRVMINEVELNPKGADYNNEWVELYNNGTKEIDINNWTLTIAGDDPEPGFCKIPPGTIIEGNGYYVCQTNGQWLDNNEEIIVR